VRHAVDSAAPPAQISHHLLTVSADRLAVVCALAGGRNRSLAFTRTRHGARKLARQLAEAGAPAVGLHGDLPQSARTRNLASFSCSAVRVMVATDIAACGIHVDGIGLVIHADPPAEPKAYVHQAGRTARAGRRRRCHHPADPGTGQRGKPPHAPRERGPRRHGGRPALAGAPVHCRATRGTGHVRAPAPQ